MIRNFTKYFIHNTFAFVEVRIISSILLLILSIGLRAQVPTISSFSPTSGPVNTTVTITGTNFDTTPTNNVVHFGATRATVSNSSATELTVNVPFGASYQPITVAVNGLLSYSSTPFITTFDGAGVDVISLADKVDISTGIQSSLVAMADLDDDGKADLIVLRSGISAIEVYRNISSGVGDISFDSKESFSSNVNPNSLDVGDFDGDGKIDVVVVGSTRVGLLRNINTTPGVMSFDDVVMYTTTETNWSVSTGDFDMDGKADLAVTSTNSSSSFTINKLLIYRNTSSGIGSISYATPVEYTTNAFPYASSVGDFDNDGKPDIAVVNEHDNTLSIYRNTNSTVGTISFAGQVDLVSGDSPISVSSGDLDEDGKLDLVVTNAADHTMSIFRNSSNGVGSISFDTKVDHTVGLTPRDVAIGDMDGDGKLDLSVVNENDNTVSVFKNITESSGLISLDTKVDFATDTEPLALVLTDIDGDGRIDMAVPAYDGSTVSILRNTSIPSLIAYYTFNGDATDQSGNANNGSVTEATLTVDRFGNADAAYSFDGVDDLITLPFTATQYLTDAFTLSAWVYQTKSTTSNAVQGIISSAVDSNDGGVALGIQGISEGNRLMALFNNDEPSFYSARNYDTFIPQGEWVLCTSTYDGSELKVYENRELVGQSSASGNLTGAGNFIIGYNSFNGIQDEFFGGSIDDVRIYDYALTETEVSNLYDIESGDLIVSYAFDGDATDQTGNGYDGVITGSVLDADDRFANANGAFSFNGSSYIIANDLPVSTSEITLSGWFNTSTDHSGSYGTYLDMAGAGALQVSEDNKLRAVLQLGEGSYVSLESNTTVNDGSWHHGVVTFNGETMTLYLDGVLEDEYAYSGDLIFSNDPVDLQVGYSNDGNDRYFIGDIDDIRYYSRALSPSEISELYLLDEWADDRAVLMSLYYNTDGANWFDNSNWGSNEDISTWFGVTVETGVVSQLDLSSNNLVGEIPSELGNLPSLILLNLFNNGLSGSIPSELGNLSNLQQLYLGVNDLSGELPSSFGNLSNATLISVSRNALSGAIPSELVNLSSLSTGLFLYSNEFTSMSDMTAFPTGATLSVYDNKLGFSDIATNLSISSTSSFLYNPQTSGNEATLYGTGGESLSLYTTEQYAGTNYQWYLNNEEVVGANSDTYTFNFTSALEGTYYVQMTNDNVPGLTINGANLYVTDGVNVAPNSLTLDNVWIEHQAAIGTYVGTFSATDVDPQDTQAYSLVAGEGDTDNAIFSIENGSQLRTASDIDVANVQYSVRVRVTDSGGEFLDVPFIILINPLHGCSNNTFTEITGTISDGSGDFPYNNSYSCSWTIEVPEGNQIQLDFTEFDIESGFDFLYVYDGSDDQSYLMSTLSGSIIPEALMSSSNTIHIAFVSDPFIVGDGWSLDYSTVTPVAYYPFDGDATDESGNGNDGIVTDATLTYDRFGNSDAAYSFNGTSSSIQTSATIASNDPFTISSWVKWDGNVLSYTEIVSWWNGASSSQVYLGTTASTGELRFGDAWNTGVYITANQWENLVATYDGSVAKIYLNGELVATSLNNPSYDMSGGDLYIGRQGTASGEFFGGAIDDIEIYDIALPASLISALYNDAGATDLLAYLPFRNSLEDASDNGYDGVQFGSSNTFSSDRVASPNDAAYNFEFENNDLVELNNTANYDFGDEITVMAWIRPDTYPTEEVKLISNVFSALGFELRLVTGDLATADALYKRKLFADIAGISYGDIGEVLLDRWTHVAFKYQKNIGTSIYINGENLITYGFVEGLQDSSIPVSAINVQIGNGYDGLMDEVKIFKSALTDSEVQDEYESEVWPFDVLALRGPETGAAEDNSLYVSAVNSAYYNEVLDIAEAGTYQFRATNTTTTLFEAFMGDNEDDGVAEPGGILLDLTAGIHGISFNIESFNYFVEPITSIGFIGSARTGDEDGWLEEDELVDLGNGVYQIQDIQLYDGEWKLRMNNGWEFIDWGYAGAEGELFTFGNNIPISEGTYTITVDILNNEYYVVDTEVEYVADLKFDGDLLDTSGYENHGTGTLTFTADRYGNANSTIDAQSVNIGSDAELNLSNGFSLNMWINPYSYDNNAGLFLSGNSFHQHLSEFDVAWRYFQDGTEKSFGVPLTAPINTWTMFTWVYDGGEMRFYDDGLLIHTEQVLGDIDTPENSYEIGVGFDGSIDDFIWAKGVLDEYDILSLYNDGYVARYALDGGAIDEVNGYDGILNGTPSYEEDRLGNANAVLRLDGDDNIDLGTNPTLHIKNGITLSAWVKPDDVQQSGIFTWGNGFRLELDATQQKFLFGSFGLSNDIMNSTDHPYDNEWHFVVGTFDGNTKRLYVDGVLNAEETGIFLTGDPYIYTDPMKIGTTITGDNFLGLIDDVGLFDHAITEEEVIELYHDGGYDVVDINSLYLDDVYLGVIDDVNAEVEVTVPSGTDISALSYARIGISRGASSNSLDDDDLLTADFTKPVVFTIVGYDGSTRDWRINVVEDQELFAYYPFNGDVLDYSDNGYDADDLSGSPSFPQFTTDPAFEGANQSYLFNGSYELTLTGTENYDFGDEITVASWIQSENYSTGEPEFISNSNFDFKLSTGTTNDALYKKLKAEVFGSTFISTGELGLNEWYHVAFTYEKNDAITTYLNGVELATTDVGDVSIGASSESLILGSGMAGLMDELRIYDRALSDEEIFEIYAENQPDLIPKVDRVFPQSAIAGNTIRIQGYNLDQPGTDVSFGGVYAAPTAQANTYLDVVVPDVVSGPLSLIVDSPAGLSSDIINFTTLETYIDRQYAFSGENQISTSTQFRRVVEYVDLDNDGDLDILSGGEGAVILHTNDGSGNFGEDISIAAVGGEDIYSIATGDLDNDGYKDVVFSSPNDGKIYLLTSIDGNVSWELTLLYTDTTVPFSFDLKVLDWDADGDLDIVSTDFGLSKLVWFQNTDGLGAFAGKVSLGGGTSSINSKYSDFDFADLNLDGSLDLIFSSFEEGTTTNQIGVWWGDGSGGSSTGQEVSANVPDVESVHLSDLDGDGDLDVLTGTSNGTGKVLWYENKPETGFTEWNEHVIESSFSADEIVSGDLDGDGDEDVVAIAFGSSNGQTMFWYENLGSGTFSARNEIGFDRLGASSVKIVDLDNDGDLDMAVAGYFAVAPAEGWVSWVESVNVESDILTYSLGVSGEVVVFDNAGSAINIEVPIGTDLSSLAAIFTLSDGAAARVNGDAGQTLQESGVTVNNFYSAVSYNIEAEDLTNNTNWIVTVTVPDGLVATYPFNANVEDESGNGFNGAIIGDVTLTTDRFGNADAAYSFDGDGDLIEAGGVPTSGKFTASGWFRSSTDQSSGFANFFTFASVGMGIGSTNVFESAVQLVEGNYTVLSSTGTVNDDAWHHGVVLFDGTAMKLYLDGTMIAEYTDHSGDVFFLNSLDDLNIGYVSAGQDIYFNGAIDDIRFYNYAILDADILALYTEGGWLLNNAPIITASQIFNINENLINNSIVGTLQASDADSDALSFSIVGGNGTGSGAFAMGLNSGQLTVLDQTQLDFETTPIFTLTIEVTDGITSVQGTATINLTDVDETVNQPPQIVANQSFSVNEDEPNDTLVGTILASDPDGDGVTFTLFGDNASGPFSIGLNDGTIALVDNTFIDFENIQAYTLNIRVSDGLETVEGAVVIIIIDVNEAPTLFDEEFTIDENEPNTTVVGTLTFTDPEDDADFSITSGNDGAFAISDIGQLTVLDQTKLDFETTPVFTLGISLNDGINDAANATITVTLNDIEPEVPNVAPTAISFANDNNDISENESVGFSLVLETTDADIGDTHSYTLVSGDGDTDNAKFEVNSGNLQTTEILNFEEASILSVRIQTEDAAGATYQEQLSIDIIDVNESASFTPVDAPTTYTFGSGELAISADVTDQEEITDVNLFFRKLSQTDFSSKSMTFVRDDNYAVNLNAAEIGLIGVEYYVESTDKFGMEISTSQIATVERPSTEALSIDDNVTPGNSVSNYSIVAFPFQSATVGTVFSGLGTYDDSKWRLLKYSSTGYSDYESGSLSPGTGYFFITTTAATIEVSGRSIELTDGVYKINLQPDANGYSLIGNPFQGTIDWGDVVQHNIDQGVISSGDVQTDLVGYSSQFTSQTNLSSLEGAFVQSNSSVSNFEIPASAITGSGGRVAREVNQPREIFIDNMEWEFDLFFETPSYKYSVGGIGLSTVASDARDNYDLSILPRFDTYLDLSFEDGSTRSVKQSDHFKSWDFKVNNNLPEKYIDMAWDIPVSSSKTIILVDAASQQIYDLSETRNIKLLNDPTVTHQLYFGDKEEIFANLDLPFDMLFNLYPNPVRDYINLELYTTEGKTVKLEFVSIDGKVAYTQLVDLQEGLTRKEIDLVGKSLTEGVYLIKIDTETITKFIKL